MLATLGACGALGGEDTSKASGGDGAVEKAKIKVAVLPVVDLAPLRLAQEGGYFKAEGLEVEAVDAPSGQQSMTKMIGGEVDIAFSTYMPFFVAKSKGAADIRLVADAVSASPKSNAVVTVPNSSVKTINDLAGKKIAITDKNTASHLLTVSVMKDHGVDTSKVQWVPMALPNIAAALSSGQVDAGYLPEPFLTQASKVVGATPVVDIATGATQDFPLAGFGALGSFVDKNPKTLAAFQRALTKAVRDSADRSKIEPLIVKYAKVDAETASLLTLPTFGSTLDPRRLQRVPDLLLQTGVLTAKLDAAPMLAPQAG
ncbi:ABC transporter substrate-binding protein [Amycolatopsis azurea]|uniref:ABC-type nitrate/sulfonate/bicarbonate transport systems-like protein n=1 Tax=Amycolatopsis azurea DSM 43854 TaxID=1238180 RepID=M2PRF3_9PSEU|nr:ABC transporter substrate-binding protein [Amycolatopsis azurea]EMD27168.1 ABC-type nitrate/sulfonate/bicarbonate transport systems-like protein [Amycolatopsis azurea DSM 43854]OOC08848.1 sulfonate ABC transporter substrate-binding protein [Amycolatopsis azurea DSM 43854]